MQPGLCEDLVTCGLAQRLEGLGTNLALFFRAVDPAEAPQALTRHLSQAFLWALSSVKEGPR